MGCSSSKLEEDEAVKLCKDRRRFIKQAVEQRTRFASGHLAYINSLTRLSAALRNYFEADESDSYASVSHASFASVSQSSFSPVKIKGASSKLHYMRSGGNPSVSVEEAFSTPETHKLEAYSPAHQQHGDYYSFYPSYSSNLSPSPTPSQWDSIWNPFSSLDYYGYTSRHADAIPDDDVRRLRRVREEEGIPELEDETEQEDVNERRSRLGKSQDEGDKHYFDEEVEEEEDEEDEDESDDSCQCECECDDIMRDLAAQKEEKNTFTKTVDLGTVEEVAAPESEGFTVFVKRRPTCMAEVVNDLDEQFSIVCNSAKEVAALMESHRAQYLTSGDHSGTLKSPISIKSGTPNPLFSNPALKLLNPVSIFRTASSISNSSRYLLSSSSSKGEPSEGSEESRTSSGSHQSTLERLYAWEKKLFEEVKSGEKVRVAYEKKCAALRNHDAIGDDPSTVDKTRAAIRDLHTQIKVSIHSVESISKRIEALRDEELHPQLFELAQGLSRMWKVMEESHRIQKRTLDEAKLLLAKAAPKPVITQHKSAHQLETEVRNWRVCFDVWLTSQREYMHALCGWLLRCIRSSSSSENFPIFGLCVKWSECLDAVNEKPVLDGIDFFAAGMGYMNTHRADSRRHGSDPDGGDNMELVEYEVAKMVDVANRILCAGMSVAIGSLTEFALASSHGFADIVS